MEVAAWVGAATLFGFGIGATMGREAGAYTRQLLSSTLAVSAQKTFRTLPIALRHLLDSR